LPSAGVKSPSSRADASNVSLLPAADNLWLYVVAIAAWLVVGCLRTIGFEYCNAVLWHNLKVEVHKLRTEQEQRLRELQSGAVPVPRARPKAPAAPPSPPAAAQPVETLASASPSPPQAADSPAQTPRAEQPSAELAAAA